VKWLKRNDPVSIFAAIGAGRKLRRLSEALIETTEPL